MDCRILVGVILALLGTGSTLGAQPILVENRACLFLDDRFVESKSGLQRTWHQGQPVAGSVLGENEAWEHWPHLFGSVLFDPHDKLYKMWYQVLNPRVGLDAREGSGRYFICYAESKNGKEWVKPKLGQVSFQGSTDNNIFRAEEAELPNVFLDPNEKDPQKRFKMLAWLRPGGHLLFASGDGKNWTKLGAGVPPYGLMPAEERVVRSDTNIVIWDPLKRRYLSAYRTYPKHAFGFFKTGHRRGVGITVSDRLLDGWGPIQTTVRAEDADDARVLRLSSSGAKNKNWSEPYCMTPFVYGNHYLGLVSMLDYIDGSDFVAGGGSLEWAFSNDGIQWKRPTPGTPAIERQRNDELFPCYAAIQTPLVIDGRLWHFYSEANNAHPVKPVAKSRIRAATWRMDGFASLATPKDEMGSLTTPLLQCPGGKLLINAEIQAGGSIIVELRSESGKPLPGRGADEAQPLSGDSPALVATWNKRSTLDEYKGTPLRIHLRMHKARVFSFRFQAE